MNGDIGDYAGRWIRTSATNASRIEWKRSNSLLAFVTNPIYSGWVRWGGEEHRGSHTPLVEDGLFEQVQRLLSIRSAGRIRERRHHHYLKGLCFCDSCDSALSEQATNYNHYFYCLGRTLKRIDCHEPYIPVDELEPQVESYWFRVFLPEPTKQELRSFVTAEVNRQFSLTETAGAATRGGLVSWRRNTTAWSSCT